VETSRRRSCSTVNSTGALQTTFQSVSEYLWKLQSLSQVLGATGSPRTAVVLAAAVSDFFVPDNQLEEHKIQSKGGTAGLTLELSPVPKLLGALKARRETAESEAGVSLPGTPWCPQSFVVSFKLETDDSILESKAFRAMGKYEVDAVVANLLHSRYDVCYWFRASGSSKVLRRHDSTGLDGAIAEEILHSVSRHRG
jgi:phosphopantothenate---cysteine ligase (ATP)